ncbi:MAG: hypothetical protein PUF81_06940 [Lachnospiraceae bacterium]|nr:hypothetical protein [Agathobacter sp.]MDD6445566.1 hypothetical protein [Lachnospiraceae bacterium]MDY4892391.1 hypothetical protein [Agathobacter sp.]
MSAKTKIVVLHMKKLIFTGVMTALGILIIVMLILLFGHSSNDDSNQESVDTMYIPGIYTSSVTIDGTPFDVQVAVDENHINSISLMNLDESVETMYPLIRPTLDELAKQIIDSQSISDITYSKNNQYTCRMLVDAVSEALKKASPQ